MVGDVTDASIGECVVIDRSTGALKGVVCSSTHSILCQQGRKWESFIASICQYDSFFLQLLDFLLSSVSIQATLFNAYIEKLQINQNFFQCIYYCDIFFVTFLKILITSVLSQFHFKKDKTFQKYRHVFNVKNLSMHTWKVFPHQTNQFIMP